jgi:lysozyme family protein
MLSNFEDAVAYVLANEGGYVNSPADAGGATNYGISLRFLREIPVERLRKYGIFEPLNEDTIRNLTLDQARMIYRCEFWDTAMFDHIENQSICNYVFDMAVHHGIAQAIRLLQRATWAATGMFGVILDDGKLGFRTINQVMILLSDKYLASSFKASLQSERAGYCRLLAAIRSANMEDLHGWLDRCYRF